MAKKQETVKINDYTLTSTSKYREARLKHPEDDLAMLTEYDKNAGAIWKGGEKLETGHFWDFQNQKSKYSADIPKDKEYKANMDKPIPQPKKAAKKSKKK